MACGGRGEEKKGAREALGDRELGFISKLATK